MGCPKANQDKIVAVNGGNFSIDTTEYYPLASYLSSSPYIPFFLYPKLLPNSEKVRLLREQEMALSGKAKNEPSGRWHMVKNVPLEVKNVITNLSWLFVTISVACASIGYSGLQAFGVKLTEIQFSVPISVASILGAVRSK